MIIPCFAFKSVEEYQEDPEKLLHERPEHCLSCAGRSCFWGHGTYRRAVVHEGIEKKVKVKRFICRLCGKTVSLLFSFLVAHRKHSAEDIAAGIEQYSTEPTTYREISGELASLDSAERTPSPSHSTVFRWTKHAVETASALCFQIQKELMLRGKHEEIAMTGIGNCPNSSKANSKEKEIALNLLAECVELASRLASGKRKVFESLHAYFLQNAETIRMFLCKHLIELSAPQKLRHRTR